MRVPLTSGFQLIPEGTYVFYIYAVDVDNDFGKIKIHMVKADGMTHIERFSLRTKDNEWNDGALNAFSFFAKAALQDFSRDDIDPKEMVGHYIQAEVKHTVRPRNDNPDKTITFVNLGDKKEADGFTEEPSKRTLKLMGKTEVAAVKPEPKPEEKKVDLAALLD